MNSAGYFSRSWFKKRNPWADNIGKRWHGLDFARSPVNSPALSK